MSQVELWVVQTRMSARSTDPERFRVGDTIDCSRTGSPSLTVKRGRDTRLDVSLTGTGDTLSFARHSHRGGHGASEKFRGEVRHIALGGVTVLVGVIGHKDDANDTGDDDDTEVVVATKPATKSATD